MRRNNIIIGSDFLIRQACGQKCLGRMPGSSSVPTGILPIGSACILQKRNQIKNRHRWVLVIRNVCAF